VNDRNREPNRERTIDGIDDIYLDYAAATPVDARVLAAMKPYFSERFENPSAPYGPARRVRADYEDARARLAHVIGAKAPNVTLTAGATEANNIALASAEGGIVTCAVEHESILSPARAAHATVVGVGGDGIVDPDDVARAITPETGLVSISLANGEVGAIQPLREVAGAVRAERKRRLEAGESRPIWLHTDASQAACTSSLAVSSLGVDLMTVSAAKVYGPKQVGMLWASDDVRLKPVVLGGGQEQGVRSGTENVAGVIGFASALEQAAATRKDESRRLAGLRERLVRAIASHLPGVVVLGPGKPKLRLPGLLSISFPGLEARRLVIALERRGVYVGTGSACAASRMRVSHVLSAMGVSDEVATGSLRITLGRPTTQEQVDAAAERIVAAALDEIARTGDPCGLQGGAR
jgi:cysteine desulfurase